MCRLQNIILYSRRGMAETPAKLFKYVGPDRIDLFETLQIRFTQPSRFNDPFEALPVIDCSQSRELIEAGIINVAKKHYLTYARQQIAAGMKPMPLDDFSRWFSKRHRLSLEPFRTPEGLQARATGQWQKFWDTIGILSLTATEQNILMWSHYCRAHEGMVIEFDPSHEFFNPKGKVPGNDFGVLTKVQYAKTRPQIKFAASNALLALPSFYTKSDVWDYEREWRVFQLLERSVRKITQANDTIHLFDVPPKCIKRVIVGVRMDVKKRVRLALAISSNPKLRHIEFWDARLDLNDFALKYISRESPPRR